MRERLQQLIDTNEFEFLKTMSEEDIWKFAFAIFYVFSEHEERTGQTLPDVLDDNMENDARFQNMVRMWGREIAIEKYKMFVLGQE